jgi:hypothetical protein
LRGAPAGYARRVFQHHPRTGPRPRAVAATLLGTLLLSLGATAGAGAAAVEGGNAFSELSQKAQEEPATTATTATTALGTEKEPGNNNKTILIGIGAAIVLLLGIGYVIVRDAKRVAPAGGDEAELSERRSARDLAVQQRKRRAKARAAKAQRKRNR